MHHIVSVAVVNPGDDLLKEPARVLKKNQVQHGSQDHQRGTLMDYLFLQLAMLYYVVKKLSTRHILHHHKDISWCGNDLKDKMCERGLLQP